MPNRWMGAADVYALGASLYTILTMKTSAELFFAEARDEILEPVPLPLRDVVLRACRYDRDERLASVPRAARLAARAIAAGPRADGPPPYRRHQAVAGDAPQPAGTQQRGGRSPEGHGVTRRRCAHLRSPWAARRTARRPVHHVVQRYRNRRGPRSTLRHAGHGALPSAADRSKSCPRRTSPPTSTFPPWTVHRKRRSRSSLRRRRRSQWRPHRCIRWSRPTSESPSPRWSPRRNP